MDIPNNELHKLLGSSLDLVSHIIETKDLYVNHRQPPHKPKIFAWGACDLEDCINTDVIKHNYKIDPSYDSKMRLRFDFSNVNPAIHKRNTFSSLISCYAKPCDISLRVYETLTKYKTQVTSSHCSIYQELSKVPFIEYFQQHASNEDYLVLSFSGELYTKYFTEKDQFTIFPKMLVTKEPNDLLHWLYKEYITKTERHMAFDDSYSLNLSSELIKDFVKDLYPIFGNRIILVKTHLTNLIYTGNTIKKAGPTCDLDIPFYKTSKLVLHDNDHMYAERLCDIILKKFQHYYPESLPVVELDEPVLLDANHPWGYSPFHLHKVSSYKIGMLIHEALSKRIANNAKTSVCQ